MRARPKRPLTDNAGRLKLYKKMLDECKQFDIASRIRDVDLTNPRAPVAVVMDSGRAIGVTLSKDNFGEKLNRAIESVTGKGAKVKSVDAGGVFPVIQYME